MSGLWLSAARGYLGELVLAGLIWFGMFCQVGTDALSSFMHQTSAAWANLTGVLFAASLTVWIAFTNLAAGAFGGYLQHRKAQGVYSVAFVFATMILFCATVVLIIASADVAKSFRVVAFAIMIYAFVNLVNLIRAASDIARLYAKFKTEMSRMSRAPRPASVPENDA
jgi:ABC-type microcin C transport system permease subunit YejE